MSRLADTVDYRITVENFEDTRITHGGSIVLAAHRLGMTPTCLAKRLRVAQSLGFDVTFKDDIEYGGGNK